VLEERLADKAAVDGYEPANRGVAAAELLVDSRESGVGEPGPAERLGHRPTEQTGFAH
jgi:hypothetical protein